MQLPLGTFVDGQSIYRNQLRQEEEEEPIPPRAAAAAAAAAAAVEHAASSLERNKKSARQRQQQKRRRQTISIEESFHNGHVHISQLVLPQTTTALLTSFGSPGFSWLESWLGHVPNVLLVHQGNGLPGGPEMEKLQEIGNAVLSPLPLPSSSSHNADGGCDDDTTSKENQTTKSSQQQQQQQQDSSATSSPPHPPVVKGTSRRPHWYQMFIKPHMGLMHSKLCLFRNQYGLRVVICGSNLYQNQHECQRDVLWIQDFFNNTTNTTTTSINNNNNNKSKGNHKFGDTLYKFCRDLTICTTKDDQGEVDRFLYTILGFHNEIDFSTAAGTLVYSFPRRQQQEPQEGQHNSFISTHHHRGGWKMLAQSVQEQFKLQRQRDKDMPGTITQVAMGLKERHDGCTNKKRKKQPNIHIKTIHVMSGSLGNVTPDFLEQMKHAMRGLQEPGNSSSSTSWDDIVAAGSNNPSNRRNSNMVGWQIYWPSQETATNSMTMHSIRANMRAIPKAYWQRIPQTARQALFTDVIHNPQKKKALVSGSTSGAAANANAAGHDHCYPNSHAKIILSLVPEQEDNHDRQQRNHDHDEDDDDEYDDCSDDELDESSLYNILYVGSHNFSISAWGLHDTAPKNVELGIVLTTSLREQRREWVRRLPYKLSLPLSTSRGGTTSPCFSSDANYVPASGWEEIIVDE